jgi:hypothetical protein
MLRLMLTEHASQRYVFREQCRSWLTTRSLGIPTMQFLQTMRSSEEERVDADEGGEEESIGGGGGVVDRSGGVTERR